MRRLRLRIALRAIALGLLGLYLFTFAVRNVTLQWDFKVYLLAARAAMAGLNPYDMNALAAIAGKPVAMPFVYPPIALVPFIAMTPLSPEVAAMCWMAVKCAVLVAMIIAWSRWIVPKAGVLAMALVAVFGWNASALADLRSGNVALIECALLWAAFACFIAERRAAFASLIVAAAIFKMMPAAYLLLLLAPTTRHRPEPARLMWAVAACVALIAVPLVIGPGAGWEGFGANIPSAHALGESNPSAYALAATLAGWCGVGGDALKPAATAIWLAYCMVLVAASWQYLSESWRAKDARRLVVIAVVLDLLIAPRPMSYGFARLGPAPLFLGLALVPRPGWALLIALIFAAQGLALSARHQFGVPLMTFSPLLLTLGLWLIVVLRRAGASGGENPLERLRQQGSEADPREFPARV